MITLQHVQLYTEENQRKTTRQVMAERLGCCSLVAEKKNFNWVTVKAMNSEGNCYPRYTSCLVCVLLQTAAF